MGKRVKKKTCAATKGKPVVVHSPKIVPEQSSFGGDAVADGVTVSKGRKSCAHLDKGFDLNKLSEKMGSLDKISCEDCRESVADWRGAKGKGKHAKKKGTTSADSKSESKAIWICLECAHFSCGGVGLPTTSQSHAVRHARQTRHPLVMQWENPHLRWCFQCNTLIPIEKTEGNGENKDPFSDFNKLIKGQSSARQSLDVEDVWFGGGSVTSEVKDEGTLSSSLEGRGDYVVRGLMNLGNTCFFNSVMQNLLAMDKLRDYFFNQDASFGPLSVTLKKLFIETKPETGPKIVINPRPFFGCVCSKAPQFRGYQQQDSHELLRCLLDGLSTEELAMRKTVNAPEEDDRTPEQGRTFVNAAFGGQISSTVCCLECGHSSTVYEPFLDLSLPVRTKRVQLASRAKKSKLPPKRGGRVRPKPNKDRDSLRAQNTLSQLSSSSSQCQTKPNVSASEKIVASTGGSTVTDSVDSSFWADENGVVSQNFTGATESKNGQIVETTMEQTVASFDNCAWLDYLGEGTISNGHDGQDLGEKGIIPDGSSTMESSLKCLANVDTDIKTDSSSLNPWGEEDLLQVKSSEVLLLPYTEESFSCGEIMSGQADGGQDEAEFDGFGALFDEPEVPAGPVAGPSSRHEVAENSFMAGNSSESDSDEVDDTDSPVSVESCLALFIKPELLCNDNAWECESCSKTLQCQGFGAKNKQVKTASITLINGGVTQVKSDPTSTDKDISCVPGSRPSDRDMDTDVFLYTTGESLVSENGKFNYRNQNCINAEGGQTDEMTLFALQSNEQQAEMNTAVLEGSHCTGLDVLCLRESSCGPVLEFCTGDEPSSTGYTTAKDQQSESHFSGHCGSEENEDEGKLSKKVMVKRDATKRVLINKAPPILTIHLKRFSQDAHGRLSKINGHINFHDTLDLRPYMDPRCENRDEHVYRLLGVVEHLGNMRRGHYEAYVRSGRNVSRAKREHGDDSVWYHASDATVRQVSLEEVLRCEAYILFYEMI